MTNVPPAPICRVPDLDAVGVACARAEIENPKNKQAKQLIKICRFNLYLLNPDREAVNRVSPAALLGSDGQNGGPAQLLVVDLFLLWCCGCWSRLGCRWRGGGVGRGSGWCCSRCCSGRGSGWFRRCLVVGKLEIDGFDFERHLVGRGEQRLKRRMQRDHLVCPGVEAQEAGERHGGLLLEILHIKLGALGHHGCKPECLVGVALGEAVADHWLVEGLEGLHPLLELLQVEAEVL